MSEDDDRTCRTYEDAADALGVNARRVRTLAVAGYLSRCGHQGHKRRVTIDSINYEVDWRTYAPKWRKVARPTFFALRVIVGLVLEGI